jgi:hypothetical protein
MGKVTWEKVGGSDDGLELQAKTHLSVRKVRKISDYIIKPKKWETKLIKKM